MYCLQDATGTYVPVASCEAVHVSSIHDGTYVPSVRACYASATQMQSWMGAARLRRAATAGMYRRYIPAVHAATEGLMHACTLMYQRTCMH